MKVHLVQYSILCLAAPALYAECGEHILLSGPIHQMRERDEMCAQCLATASSRTSEVPLSAFYDHEEEQDETEQLLGEATVPIPLIAPPQQRSFNNDLL